MPALSDYRLRQLLLRSLPGAREAGTGANTKPILLEVPGMGLTRIYLWTTTPDRSTAGRPVGEHKAQIILPGTARGSRQHLLTGDITTALLGYSPVFGIFTAWQAERHSDSGYSKNLQFQEELMANAVAFGWAVGATRFTDAGPEVRVAFHPVHLYHYLRVLRDADASSLAGEARKAFFILNRPPRVPDPAVATGENPAQQERRRVMTARLQRDSAFSRNVAAQFGGACAVCGVQLSVTEGAHIIPVHDNRSTDDVWNGVCLCANHHRLYDNRILRITQDAVVQQNPEEVNVLRELGLFAGHETIVAPFLGRNLRLPGFYQTNEDFRQRFHSALRLMDIY
jgi:putative restriction endonuclease